KTSMLPQGLDRSAALTARKTTMPSGANRTAFSCGARPWGRAEGRSGDLLGAANGLLGRLGGGFEVVLGDIGSLLGDLADILVRAVGGGQRRLHGGDGEVRTSRGRLGSLLKHL